MTSSIDNARRALEARASGLVFPRGFVFGAATAAYQIEGSPDADGKGESIWDRFCRIPGAIVDGSSGDVACDHYHRWKEDIAVLKALGLGAYRFSFAWTRLLPEGRGEVNAKGIAFYDRLIDDLLEAGIEPYATLYHWDLPQALQDRGGWYNRETAAAFADYAGLAARSFGDRVRKWTTLNEPWTFCWSGHATGEDAPGFRDGVKGGVAASHHALLAHGLAVPVIRAEVADAQVGIVFDLNVAEAASDEPRDVAATRRFDGAQNRWFLDAVFKGAYPEDMLALYGDLLPPIHAQDNEIIAAPLDYLGINIYRRSVIAAGDELAPLSYRRVQPEGIYSAVDYEIWPRCMYDILRYVNDRYAPPAIYISENGVATTPETVGKDGHVWDDLRATYYVDHLEQVAKAAAEGVPVRGYFAWTLTDNFEWAYGYTTPFGITHVDFATQQRHIKYSGDVYAMIARQETAPVAKSA
ncbi:MULTISPECIES: GH1 family beta-glucosidase [unclassified Mesorhizobium]|uniref:GH1 family beta-glucosidase n=1 Tax=unclassified Mesorhizobium TaxID=325217 RepID=UPI000FCA8FAE|nr:MULTISPECIES: GH1 family beta-glucosidase [unclassified Mesorhizobium]RUW45564.1 beta-glucosidase [Mesorhizobium sp. M8A.F.Ca.ET.021.01.1.1]TGP98131.1 beta-glucosidase [Mesorhizobium sp. M8A.F.Ca.ET.218.01.1.1]TGQ92749.1 beta-glucosidase [Mesorhizobium sp. M8A.F.Ca.ET.208.01.1.1]TGS38600.1 beta-glucosidase [Mesorhizobium sp. M8A.F.Ca.ET.182.01.1.1]TGS77096.1 beta-glucosidase [Mesorhizobium sp. M8A.F.Ca.ET.181.01.1.1]